jgi:hypothetical protein
MSTVKRFIDPDNPFEPVPCICIPVEDRKEELALLAQARIINNGPCIDKVRIMELLEILSHTDDECSGFCLTCRYEKSCEMLNKFYMEAFK